MRVVCFNGAVHPIVCFLPGAGGAAAFWEPAAAQLPSAWDVRLLSWPGAGHEPHRSDVSSYSDLIAYAADRIPNGSDVVAQSMGGAVAIGVALAQPEKIRRLVLVATSGGLDVEGNGAENWRADYRCEFPEAAPWVSEQRIDYTEKLHRITIPTCLIWGDADPISPLAVGQALNDTLSNSSLHILPSGTHVLAREHPREVAALIDAHLRGNLVAQS